MQWSRIKTIILLLLALVNGFLLVLVVTREGEAARRQTETIEAAVQILQQNGIQIEAEEIPQNMELVPYRVERNRESEKQIATTFLGETEEENRGGDVFRYVSTEGKGSVQFHSGGEFSAIFSTGAVPLGEEEPQEHAVRWMEAIGMTCEVLECEPEGENGSRVLLRQQWEGAPIYSCTAEFHYSNQELRSITNGRRVTGTPGRDEQAVPVTLPTVLIRFLSYTSEWGDVSSQITRIETGYDFSASLTGTGRLTPVWRIDTETKSYEIDALTGAFTRTEDHTMQ